MAWNVLIGALMVGLPILTFVGALLAVKVLSGRREVLARYREAGDKHRRPLNERLGGYDAEAAAGHWKVLRELLPSEQAFLELDLVFPVFYGGGLAASLLIGWSQLGRPWYAALLVLLPIVTVLADWVENLVQLRQLRRFEKRGAAEGAAALDRRAIALASRATQIKLVGFGLSATAVVALAVVLILGAVRGG